MEASNGPAAPASGSTDDILTFEELAADPEIAALLDFEPVPRNPNQPKAWTPDLQRKFIAALAVHGSKSRACEEVRKNRTGIDTLYNHPEGASFRAAWHAAKELYERRKTDRAPKGPAPLERPPSIDRRRKDSPHRHPVYPGERSEGQIMNEDGECEDEESYRERGDEACDSICNKLLRIRRLYLQEISASPGKRAAFEILTDLPIDWDKAAKLEPQHDEPWRSTSQRQPDMILAAESGWTFGELGYGPDRKAELRATIDRHRAAEGLPPVDWTEPSPSPRP